MYSLMYRSLARPFFDTKAIHKMLLEAQESNRQQQITGCLLFHKGQFIQLIEGEEDIILDLYDKILADERHYKIRLLHTETNHYRLFESWSMIFNNLNDPSAEVEQKRDLFREIFHESAAVPTPNKAKLALWKHVFDLLQDEGMLKAR